MDNISFYLNHEYLKQSEQLSDLPSEEIKLSNETDKVIYDYIKRNGSITTQEVLKITGIKTMSGASAALNRLIDSEVVFKVRQGRQFIYKLME